MSDKWLLACLVLLWAPPVSIVLWKLLKDDHRDG